MVVACTWDVLCGRHAVEGFMMYDIWCFCFRSKKQQHGLKCRGIAVCKGLKDQQESFQAELFVNKGKGRT